MENPEAVQLTTAEFSENEKRVLEAAYVYAGYDPTSYISTQECLGQKPVLGGPFRVPLQTSKTFAPRIVDGVEPSEDATFVPLRKSTQNRIVVSPIGG